MLVLYKKHISSSAMSRIKRNAHKHTMQVSLTYAIIYLEEVPIMILY